MTIEQYEKLQEHEYLLYTAIERNYVMFGSLDKKKKISQIYSEVFGRKSSIMNGCSSCALREMKVLASEYFRIKKQLEETQVEAKEEIKEEQQKENKTRKARKKKEE